MRGPLEVKDIPAKNAYARSLGGSDDLPFNPGRARSTREEMQVRHKADRDR